MSPEITPQLHIDVGGAAEIEFHLKLAGAQETLTVSAAPMLVETKPSAVSTLLDERAMNDLPLNGRRFSDLALFSPGVTQDPRSLTSATNGDLSFGGIRGFQNTFLVDGGDYNNAFFAQARGRYRTPYNFSTEMVQEFRVSSNAYGAEQGRSGGAVVNVVTKSGSNHLHGTAFYYLRDSSFGATNPFLSFKPHNRQQQVGGTIGGPIKRNKVFFFTGFDQHVFRVPNVVQFLNGSSQLRPQPGTDAVPGDYEATDSALVFAAAAQLSSLTGEYPAAQIGNSAYAKLDINISPRHQLGLRVNTTRYWGSNNVFLDPASPVTYDSISNNGQELVATETVNLALTSGLGMRWLSHFRAQFSRDRQQSYTNSSDVLIKIPTILDAIGRSSMLPRETREHRVHLADTVSVEGPRHALKFGGDALITKIFDFFPSQQSGEYLVLSNQGQSLHLRTADGSAATHASAGVRAPGAALLPAEFRQRGLASGYQRICRLRARHDAPDQSSRRESGSSLGSPDLHHPGAALESSVPARAAKCRSSRTTSRPAPGWHIRWATGARWSFAPDTASFSSASRRSTTRSFRRKTGSPTPISS